MHIIKASPDPLLSSFRLLNEQRPTVPKEGGIYLRSFMIMHYALCMMNYLKGSISLRSYKQEFGGFLSHCNIATDNT